MSTDSQNRTARISTAVTPDEAATIAKAAEALGDREQVTISVSDVVRSGALRRANEILEAEGQK